jgi:membrane-associated phospholipid phosphatase
MAKANQGGNNIVTTTFPLKSRFVVLLLSLSLTAISYYYLDTRIARFVYQILSTNHLIETAADIPDLLLHIVIAVTAFSWVGYFILIRRGIHNRLTDLMLACGTVVPMAFVAKTFLQYMFGRPNPYAWLLTHEPPRFYWFRDEQGYGCFPSGHMTVFTSLMTTLSYHYPRYRFVYFGALCLLALALIITDYHFLSDVLAGAVLGSMLAYSISKRLRGNRG